MHEDKEYSRAEVGDILSEGISPAAVERWPLIRLPEALVAVARASLIEDAEDRFALEELEYAQRPVRGLRTSWGCIVGEFNHPSSAGETMVWLSGYLRSDPFLQLPHLRQNAEDVGMFLSDLANAILAPKSERYLKKSSLEWSDNDMTSQLFCLLGFFDPADEAAFEAAGRKTGAWLAATDIDEALRACQDPKLLSGLTERSLLPITRSVLQ